MSALPVEMDAAVLHGVEDLRVERRRVPAAGPGQLLVEVASVGVCGSDVHYYREGRAGTSVVSRPTVLGHEFGGVVVAAGPGVDPGRVGERVGIEPGTGCGECLQCGRGRYNLCPRMHFLGCAPIDGALQQYVVVSDRQAFPVPDGVGDDAAALLEPLSVALSALHKAAPRAGEDVLVLGAGPIGNLVAQVLLTSPAASVTVVDLNAARLSLLPTDERLRSSADPRFEDESFDVVVECTGAPAALAGAMGAMRGGGRVVLVGVGPQRLELLTADLQEREISVLGCHRYRDTWPTAIDLVTRGQVRLDELVTHTFPLAEAASAITVVQRERSALKAVVRVGAGR